MIRQGFIAFYEDVGEYSEGDREGITYNLGVLTSQKPTVEQWRGFVSLMNETSCFERGLLDRLRGDHDLIQEALEKADPERCRIIVCEEGVKDTELFAHNLAYLRIVDVGPLTGPDKLRRMQSGLVARGPIKIERPLEMQIYEFKRESRVGDSPHEVFAKTQELVKLAS